LFYVHVVGGPPDDVDVTVTSPHSVEVKWDPSSSLDANGYRITYTTTASYISMSSRTGNEVVDGRASRSHTITGLEEDTLYVITIQTRTNNGFSVDSDNVPVTTWTSGK